MNCHSCNTKIEVNIQPGTENCRGLVFCPRCGATNITKGLLVRYVQEGMIDTDIKKREPKEVKPPKPDIPPQTTEQMIAMSKSPWGRELLAIWRSPEAQIIALRMVKESLKKIKTEKSF